MVIYVISNGFPIKLFWDWYSIYDLELIEQHTCQNIVNIDVDKSGNLQVIARVRFSDGFTFCKRVCLLMYWIHRLRLNGGGFIEVLPSRVNVLSEGIFGDVKLSDGIWGEVKRWVLCDWVMYGLRWYNLWRCWIR